VTPDNDSDRLDDTTTNAVERIREIAANHDIEIDRLIVFGS